MTSKRSFDVFLNKVISGEVMHMEWCPTMDLIALITFFICVDQFYKAASILYVITMRAWSQLSSAVSPCEIGYDNPNC